MGLLSGSSLVGKGHLVTNKFSAPWVICVLSVVSKCFMQHELFNQGKVTNGDSLSLLNSTRFLTFFPMCTINSPREAARVQRATLSVPAHAAHPNTAGHKCRCTAPLDKSKAHASCQPTHRFFQQFTTPDHDLRTDTALHMQTQMRFDCITVSALGILPESALCKTHVHTTETARAFPLSP